MKFGQRFSIRKGLETEEFSQGIWNPTTRAWRDVVEDYLYISKKRMGNKLALFKLQFSILADIILNIKYIDKCKSELDKLGNIEKENDLKNEDLKRQKSYFDREIFSLRLINKALREIVDGIVWRTFDFNRAVLYMLADKEPIETIREDKGLLNSIDEFGEVFLNPDNHAIFNDITNFLRVGDITEIEKDGNINFIEVKSSKWRKKRVTR